jgi:hypothetical protein
MRLTVQNSLIVAFAVSVLTVGCGSSNPIAPNSVGGSSSSLATAAPATPASGPSAPQALFPPIEPAGISCPSDAPQIRVGSLGSRMDIDFSDVKGASQYEIQITNNAGALVGHLMVPAPANHAQWYGLAAPYLVRVRTHNCGGMGNWSESIYHHLSSDVPPPSEGCNMAPDFEVTQEDFTFWPGGELMNGDVAVRFDNSGIWFLALVRGNSDADSDTEAERATGGVSIVNSGVTLHCGESAVRTLHETTHIWPYWWFRIYRDGVLMYTSQRHSL